MESTKARIRNLTTILLLSALLSVLIVQLAAGKILPSF